MLRYKEKEDFDARFAEVDAVVEKWSSRDKDVSDQLRQEFLDKLIISLIYHDSALEGDVLTHSEIKASIDAQIISDTSLIPAYDQINNFNAGVRFASDYARSKRKPIKLDTVKELHNVLQPEDGSSGSTYRKENPLHRLYYHEISPPEKIAYRMRKFGDWLENDATKAHPIRWAAEAHWRLMGIFPWTKHSGQTARCLANMILERNEHPIAVIHSIDRQRYYEALRARDTMPLLSVYLEAVETTATAALRVYEAAGPRKRSRKRKAG